MSGVTAQCQEQQLNPPAKNIFSQCGLELTDDAGTTFPCAHQVKSSNIVQDHIGCVHTVKFFSENIRSDGANILPDSFWPAAQNTFSVVAQKPRVLPERKCIFRRMYIPGA